VAAYRDTFRLLLQYWRRKRRQALATLSLESLTPDTVLSFLNHLEQSRGNTIRTRNARLAALRSFVHYLTDWLGPELPAATRRILTLPFKRQVKPLIGYLTRPEIEALLAATEDTWTGRRDLSRMPDRQYRDHNCSGWKMEQAIHLLGAPDCSHPAGTQPEGSCGQGHVLYRDIGICQGGHEVHIQVGIRGV
jgi:hypothetical protein